MVDDKEFERIWYDLDVFDGDLTLPFWKDIVEVLSQLPQDVYDYIIKNVQFKIIGVDKGEWVDFKSFQETTKKKGMIILKNNVDRFTIAHEIAHAFLKHDYEESKEDREAETDKLAEKWGFKKLPIKMTDVCKGNEKCKEHLEFTGHMGIWTCMYWQDQCGCTNPEKKGPE